jgi:hypothetical protein
MFADRAGMAQGKPDILEITDTNHIVSIFISESQLTPPSSILSSFSCNGASFSSPYFLHPVHLQSLQVQSLQSLHPHPPEMGDNNVLTKEKQESE